MSYEPLATSLVVDLLLLRGSLRLAITTISRMTIGEPVELEKVMGLLEAKHNDAGIVAKDALSALNPKKEEKAAPSSRPIRRKGMGRAITSTKMSDQQMLSLRAASCDN